MNQRDPDLSAAVYVALSGGVMLLCLVGALLLPVSYSIPRWLRVGLGVGTLTLIVGSPFFDRFAHRSRIRDAVRELGGTLVRIRRLPFWRQEPDWVLPIACRTKHRVDYMDLTGVTHRALCRSGWFHGVEWLEDNVCNPEDSHAPL